MAQRYCTVAFVTAKGGSGKSTLACCLAAELAHRKRKVTLIDSDPQGGMSAWHAAGGPLEAAGVDVAKSEIGQRTAFAVAALNGTAPCWMGAAAETAAAETAALTDELKL